MNQFKNCPLVYLLCTKREIFTLESYKSFRRLLEILEVDVDNLRLITEPTQFDKIILPNSSFERGIFTAEYREMIERVRDFALKNRTPIPNKKLYFYHGLRQRGEERLAQYFKAKGYAIIQPENLTFDEQLNWLINCESFASTLGSCAHNSLFLRDGTETIFIPRLANDASNYFQRACNQVSSVNANYLDSTLSLFGATFYIISRRLKEFFGDKWNGYEEEDFKNFLSHVKLSLSRNIPISPKADAYYAPIFEDFMAQLKQRGDLITACDMPPRWQTFKPSITYSTHVSKKGWGDGWKSENTVSNELDKKLDLQAIKINFPNQKVYYSVYYNDKEGWSQEVSSGEIAGITGKGKPIYGIKIWLDEVGTKKFNILYRIHKFDDTWTSWAKNGETLYSYGQMLNAIQIKLEPVTPQAEDEEIKETPNETQSNKAYTKKFDATWTFEVKNDDTFHQQLQRQNLTQITVI